MTKRIKTKKTEQEDFLSKNHDHAIKYRKRVQEELETEQELKEWLKNNELSNRVLPEK